MPLDNSNRWCESPRNDRARFDAHGDAEIAQQEWGAVFEATLAEEDQDDFGQFESAPPPTHQPAVVLIDSSIPREVEIEAHESDHLLALNPGRDVVSGSRSCHTGTCLNAPLIQGFDTPLAMLERPVAPSKFTRVWGRLPFQTARRKHRNGPERALAEFERGLTTEERSEISSKEMLRVSHTLHDQNDWQPNGGARKPAEEPSVSDNDDSVDRAASSLLNGSQSEMLAMVEEERGIWDD